MRASLHKKKNRPRNALRRFDRRVRDARASTERDTRSLSISCFARLARRASLDRFSFAPLQKSAKTRSFNKKMQMPPFPVKVGDIFPLRFKPQRRLYPPLPYSLSLSFSLSKSRPSGINNKSALLRQLHNGDFSSRANFPNSLFPGKIQFAPLHFFTRPTRSAF